MTRGGLRRLVGPLGPAVMLVLGCGRVIADGGSEGHATGSTSDTEDEGATTGGSTGGASGTASETGGSDGTGWDGSDGSAGTGEGCWEHWDCAPDL